MQTKSQPKRKAFAKSKRVCLNYCVNALFNQPNWINILQIDTKTILKTPNKLKFIANLIDLYSMITIIYKNHKFKCSQPEIHPTKKIIDDRNCVFNLEQNEFIEWQLNLLGE